MFSTLINSKKFIQLLYQSIRSNKWGIILLTLLIFIVTAINIYIPVYAGKFGKKIIEDTIDKDILIVLISLYIIKLAAQYFMSRSTNYLSAIITLDLKNKVFSKFLYFPFGHHSFIETGDFHQRVFNELGLLQGKLIFGSIYFIKDIFFFLFLVINIFYISPLLFIDLMLFSIIIYLFHLLTSGKIKLINKHTQLENAKLSSLFLETLNAKEDIIAFKIEKKINTIFKNISSKLDRLVNQNAKYKGLIDVFVELMIILFLGSIFLILFREKMPTEKVITTVSYIAFLLWPIKSISDYLVSLNSITPSITRIEEVIQKLSKHNSSYSNRKIIVSEKISIDLHEVTFNRGKKVIFDDFSLSISRGAYLLKGKNGIGKSTLANLVLGTLKIQKGQINISVTNTETPIGLVSQYPFLYNSSILDNLMLNEISKSDIDKAMNHYDLNSFGLNLEKKVGENGRNLSGGEKQLISILRGILQQPDILILDEITNNLPAVIYEKLILKIVHSRTEKITLIISHLNINSIKFDGVIKL